MDHQHPMGRWALCLESILGARCKETESKYEGHGSSEHGSSDVSPRQQYRCPQELQTEIRSNEYLRRVAETSRVENAPPGLSAQSSPSASKQEPLLFHG